MNTMELEDFPFITYDKVRYSDTDRQGHVNNSVFTTYLETGRVEFLIDSNRPVLSDGCSFVLAAVNLQLVGEIFWPGKVDIGTGILKIGTSSIQIYQHVYQNGRLTAKATTTVVQVNSEGKSEGLSILAKKEFEQYIISNN